MKKKDGPMPGVRLARLSFEQDEWNAKNQSLREIKMVCHYCYEKLRSHATTISDLSDPDVKR